MAVHHDNFDMWDSKYQPRWNSMNYGPKVDVCKAIRDETLKAGLRWGVSTHLERTYSWFQSNKGADKTGHKPEFLTMAIRRSTKTCTWSTLISEI